MNETGCSAKSTQRMRVLFAAAAAILLGGVSLPAGLITSTVGMPGTPATVDFSQFPGGFISTAGPVQIGGLVGEDITWQTNHGGSLIGNGSYSLGGNGQWTPGRDGYTASNEASTSVFMRYEFHDGPVGAAGGFVNYSPGAGSFFVEALDAGGAVLESYLINSVAPISTPGATDAGAFRGISREANDIFALQLRGAFGVLDDLTFGRHPSAAAPPPDLIASAVEFSVRNAENGDPSGVAVTNTTNVEVGNLAGGSSPDVRGLVEFGLQAPGLLPVAEAYLTFTVLQSALQSSPGPSGVAFDILVEAYAANGAIDVSDFQAASLGMVGTFSTSGLGTGAGLGFDVTGFYNDALAGGFDLGFRLRQQDELNDARHLGYTFDGFRLELTDAETSVVPEPSTFALLTIGAMGVGGAGWRRRRRPANHAAPRPAPKDVR
ncbi:MAG TPA: PEP-CTERM sorting domain-containing protein [Planctomycetaceae bacterium]|nr:PEP-CTERM sorting domain-containing protein [Planctomycetaceae bacterium]